MIAMSQITDKQRQQIADAFASANSDISGRATQAQQNTDYPKPIVTQATNDVLAPLLASPSGITVDVAYTGMLNTDLIGLSFNGDESYEPMNGSLFQKVTFKVSMAAVAAAIGSTVEVKYVVVRSTGAFFSEILNLIVQPIPTSALPTPQITQASAGKLDVNKLDADPEVTVAPWPLIGVGQQLWLRLESSSNQDIWQAFPITDTGTQSTTIPLEYLQGLGEGSELRLVLEVSFNNDATRQAFPLQSYQLVSEGAGGGEVTEDFESFLAHQIIDTTFATKHIDFTFPDSVYSERYITKIANNTAMEIKAIVTPTIAAFKIKKDTITCP
jgi:hypothetical protein